MGPLTGNPCLRAPLASLPWSPPSFTTPLKHCLQVCTFTPSFLLVLSLNSGSCGYTTVHHWLSHLLSHNHSTSFWEAFAMSRVCAQVVCNTTRGRYYKKQAELGKIDSWALAEGKLLSKDCLKEVSQVGALGPIPEPEGQRSCSSDG